jgi:RHS repeat-associated protein
MMVQTTAGSDDRQYVYTADDERIGIRQGASWTWTVRDPGGKVLREFAATESTPLTLISTQWSKDYVWRDGLLLASVAPVTPGSSTLLTYHYHLDHLGTPRLITDSNHFRVAEHAYYPFGPEFAVTPHESSEEAMKFTGHERDLVAGNYLTLDDMHARFYGSTVGRFLTIDPILSFDSAIQDPQSWNRYTYVHGSPIGRIDPDGRADKGSGILDIQLVEVDPYHSDIQTIVEESDGGRTEPPPSGDKIPSDKLPNDPSDLSDRWTLDPTHRNPSGKLFRDPDGNVLEWHQAQPGERGERGRNHWHYRPGGKGGDDHLHPGDEIPGLSKTTTTSQLWTLLRPNPMLPTKIGLYFLTYTFLNMEQLINRIDPRTYGPCTCGR